MVFNKESVLFSLREIGNRFFRRSKYSVLSYGERPYIIGQEQTFSERLGVAVSSANLFTDTSGYILKTDKEVVSLLQEPESLTEFGRTLKSIVKGRRFVDLGCGNPLYSNMPRLVAEAFQAKEYVGVDSELPQPKNKNIFGIPVQFLRADMLSFLSQLKKRRVGIVFHLAGIEPRYSSYKQSAAQEYTDKVLKRIQRLTRKGDGIIIGEATIGFDPTKYGFELVQTSTRLDRYNERMDSQHLYIKK